MQPFGEVFPETDLKDRILHAHLENDALSFMASDTHPEHSPPFIAGNNVSLSIVGSDEAILTDYFNKLAEDGMVGMPLEKQFWGDVFGMLTDQFGVHWMVNIASP